MPVSYEIKDGVLHAVVTGVYGSTEAKHNRDTIARMVEESGVRLGLVDLRGATIRQTTVDVYQVNTSLDEFIPKDSRFAFVYAPETLTKELAKFSENVLVNAGYDARVTTEYDEALEWVKEGR